MRALHTPEEASRWLRSRVTGTISCDSRKVGSGDGFIAWPGAATDGRKFVQAALQQGAQACLVEQAGVEAFDFAGDAIATYAGLKAATGPIAALYFDEPTTQLDVLAATGTNGKTSTAWWLAQALSQLPGAQAIPCGLIGTLGTGRPPHVVSTGLTTPDPVLLQGQFRRFVDEGVKLVNTAIAMRVPSRRRSATPIEEASIAQAPKPRRAKARNSRCSITGSGVVRPV